MGGLYDTATLHAQMTAASSQPITVSRAEVGVAQELHGITMDGPQFRAHNFALKFARANWRSQICARKFAISNLRSQICFSNLRMQICALKLAHGEYASVGGGCLELGAISLSIGAHRSVSLSMLPQCCVCDKLRQKLTNCDLSKYFASEVRQSAEDSQESRAPLTTRRDAFGCGALLAVS
jgi:hypothetical protein